MKTVFNNFLKPMKSQKRLKQYLPKDVINVVNMKIQWVEFVKILIHNLT